MQKKTKKTLTFHTYQKVILTYIITFSICALILYPTMHKILNYPPGTVDTQFQVDYGGLTYTQQFGILFLFITTLFVLYQRFFLFKKIANWEKFGATN